VCANIAAEITGGISSALISGLLMLLTNGLIKELALLLLSYPLRTWVSMEKMSYINEHLVCASVQETLGGVGQTSTLSVLIFYYKNGPLS